MKRFVKSLVYIFLVVLLASCSNKKSSDVIRLGSLKGPTSMGLATLITNNVDNQTHAKYDVTLSALPEEIATKFLKGELDIVSVPVNLASVLFNKTDGDVKLISINTEDAIYVLENKSSDYKSVSDLVHKKIYAQGKGVMPDAVLETIINKSNLKKEDFDIDWKSEGSEVIASSLKNDDAILLLPEPYASVALEKNKNLKRAFSFSDEWNRVGLGEHIAISVIIARKSFYDSNKKLIDSFKKDFKNSIDDINNNPNAVSDSIDKLGIATKQIAEKSIPNITFEYKDGKEAKEQLTVLYEMLYAIAPRFVGGVVPTSSFY